MGRRFRSVDDFTAPRGQRPVYKKLGGVGLCLIITRLPGHAQHQTDGFTDGNKRTARRWQAGEDAPIRGISSNTPRPYSLARSGPVLQFDLP